MTLSEAYRILQLSPDAALADVRAAYRRRAAEAHPDRGGSTAEFIKIRAAYEILVAFMGRGASAGTASGASVGAWAEDEEVPIPDELRVVIDQIVTEFRQHQRWAEMETLEQLSVFQRQMSEYIRTASRTELRQLSPVFRHAWTATLSALFNECNEKSDEILQRYESWYTQSTQAVFDDLYRKDLFSFAWRRHFWEAFAVVGAIAAALTVVIGWGGARRWVSMAVLIAALGIAFLVHRRTARRRRNVREKAEPLSVVPFELSANGRFPTEAALRRGRRTTAAFGAAGLFLGSAASAGLAIPAVAAMAGAALGGAFDRFVNPTGRVRESMQADLLRFMEVARPQLVRYVLEAHQELLADVRTRITESYQERVRSTVKLLTAGK